MTGPVEGRGLTTYVISDFEPQGKVSLQHDVGPASVIPDKIEAARGIRGPAEAISPKPDGGEWLHLRPQPEIADVIERKKVEAIVS
jgi:hypothetical protein